MRMRGQERLRRVLGIILLLVLVCGVSVSASYVTTERMYKQAYEQILTDAESRVESYLQKYEVQEEVVYMQPDILGGTPPPDGTGYLTQGDITGIVSSIEQSLEYSLIKDLINANKSASEEQMDALRESIYFHVEGMLGERSVTAELSAQDRESIVSAVSSIVKSSVMNSLYEYRDGNSGDIVAIKSSIDKDVSRINSTLTQYSTKFGAVSKQIDTLNSDLSKLNSSSTSRFESVDKSLGSLDKDIKALDAESSAKIDALRTDLTGLTRSHQALEADVVLLSQYVAFSEDAQMSLAEHVDANTQLISSLALLLDDSYQELQENLEELRGNTVTISSKLEHTATLLTQYADGSATKEELSTAVSDAKQALEQQLGMLGDQTDAETAEIRGAIDTLSGIQTSLAEQQGEMSTDFSNQLRAQSTALSGSIDGVSREVEALQASLTTVGSDLSQAQSSITSLSQSLAQLSQSVSGYAVTVNWLNTQLTQPVDENGTPTMAGRLGNCEQTDTEQTTSIGQLTQSLTTLTDNFNALKLAYETSNDKMEDFLSNGAVYVQRWDASTKTLYLAPYDNTPPTSP